MTNTILGVGKVQNGRVSFVSNVGGFVRPLSERKVENVSVTKPVVSREPVEKNEVSMTKQVEVINVPSFMMSRKPEPKGQVIYVNFAKEQEEKDEEPRDAIEVIDAVVGVARKVITKNPVFKYFFGDVEEEE